MSYSLKKGRPIPKELSRLLRKEFRTALEKLDQAAEDEEAIHEARKSVKKIRAIVRLLRKALGSDYDAANRRLRAAAQHLSALRDVDVLTETVDGLHGHHRAVFTTTVRDAVRRGLRRRQRLAHARASPTMGRAKQLLRRTANWLPRQIRRVSRPSMVEAGVVQGYRRARQAMQPLSLASPASAFHAWRRRTKDHWYHMRLFRRRHAALARRAQALGRLETLLGDDHDLEVLRTLMIDAPERFGHAKMTAIALGCVDKSQRTLRERALTLGRRLFSTKPRKFHRAVATW